MMHSLIDEVLKFVERKLYIQKTDIIEQRAKTD